MIFFDVVILDIFFFVIESMYEYVNVMVWFIIYINLYFGYLKKLICRWFERGRIMGIL